MHTHVGVRYDRDKLVGLPARDLARVAEVDRDAYLVDRACPLCQRCACAGVTIARASIVASWAAHYHPIAVLDAALCCASSGLISMNMAGCNSLSQLSKRLMPPLR